MQSPIKTKQLCSSFLFILTLTAALSPLRAEVSLNDLFTDHMVLQRDKPIPIWGSANPGEKVTVKFGTAEVSTETDASGKWMVKIPPQTVNATSQEMTITGKNTVVIKDIVVGDVWVCAGQSNMEFRMGESLDANEEAATANYPLIRHFTVHQNVQNSPQENLKGNWSVCTPQSVKGFTAVGYYFGRDLHKDLNIPIGLLHSSWGGSFAESWTPAESLQNDPDLLPIFQRSQAVLLNYVQILTESIEKLKPWQAEAEKASSENKPIPSMPMALRSQPTGPMLTKKATLSSSNDVLLPTNPLEGLWFASSRYNGMIAPLLNHPICGVIWYQGESNADQGLQYRKLLPSLITGWRKACGQSDLPFYIVQLPNYRDTKPMPCDSNWAELREAQSLTATNIPHCGMAVTIDVGEAGNVHPKNKKPVGARLALVARANAYGEKLEFSGPQYDSMTVEGNKVILKFQHLGSGLIAKGDAQLKQFAIADESKQFVWANARIEGDTVVVSNDTVQKPVAVRYAWQDNPEGCNLYNKEGLPASPFRTDDWPLNTVK